MILMLFLIQNTPLTVKYSEVLFLQQDIFQMEIVDLGKIYKCKIRHDNALLNPSWFLDRVEVVDSLDKETYTFHSERWLAKNKDDGKIERSLYVKVSGAEELVQAGKEGGEGAKANRFCVSGGCVLPSLDFLVGL